MKTIFIIIIIALLGMGFYLNDKVEKLEAKLAYIDTLHVKTIHAKEIYLTNINTPDTVYMNNMLVSYKYYQLHENFNYKKTLIANHWDYIIK